MIPLRTDHYDYADADTVCEAYVARPHGDARLPCVLVAHQWAGLSDHERGAAEHFAESGYVGFAIDVYGKGVRGAPMADNSALMNPYLADRARLLRRLLAAVAAAKAHPAVDPRRIAIIGYCFGGLCALDLARSGTGDIRGAVSVHGLFAPPGLGEAPKIRASVLALHGWNDPMATPADVVALGKELTDAQADWQIHAYGGAMHAFTAPGANAPERGIQYNATADHRSRAAMLAFLAEVLA